MEIYISNIKKYFNNGELIEINYVDANGVSKVFSERIIGTLSNIRINSNIRTDPQQRRRGLLYNIGDPVVITGGLGNSPEANDAAAIVGNVTLGSIEAVTMVFPGYGYRLYSNTETIVYRSVGDDPNANLSTDLRVLQLNSSACTTNSQLNFIESITYDKTVIDYLADTLIGNANYAAFTTNTRNSLINVTENDSEDPFNNFEEVWANGTNFSDALFTAKIATPNGNTRIGGTVSFLGDTSISGTISVYGNIALTGTVSTNVSNWYITGNGTSFLSEITAGEYVTVLDQARQVVSVDSNIKLTLSQPFSFTRTGLNAYKGNTTIIGSGTTFTSSINVNDFLVVNNEIAKVANVVNNTILIVSSPFSFTGSGYTAHKNLYSTALSVIGNSTNFISTLSPGQQLEVNGDRAIIANIANDTFLNVVAAYSSTFSDNTAYRIGSFAANGGFGTEYTGDMIFYDVSNIGPLATILAGSQINTRNTAKSFVVNSLATASMNANSNSMIIQCLDFDTVNTGGVALVSVLNGGAGFRSEPAIDIS